MVSFFLIRLLGAFIRLVLNRSSLDQRRIVYK